MELPDYFITSGKEDAGEPLTMLERFVLDNEPAGLEHETEFRTGLSDAIQEAADAHAISGFYEDRWPEYEDGPPRHELQELATASEVNGWVERTRQAIDMAVQCGGADGAHHKAWVIDQMVRILAAGNYSDIVREAKAGEDGPETYEWDVGIAP